MIAYREDIVEFYLSTVSRWSLCCFYWLEMSELYYGKQDLLDHPGKHFFVCLY